MLSCLKLKDMTRIRCDVRCRDPEPVKKLAGAATQWVKVTCASALLGPRVVRAVPNRKRGDIAAAAALWEHAQARSIPAIRQLLTHAEIQRRSAQRREQTAREIASMANNSRPCTAP